MKVHSKIDLFNIILFIFYALALAVPFLTFGFHVWYLCVYVAVVVFIATINFGTSYKLTDNGLRVQNGIFGYTISYDRIKSITKVKTLKFSSNTAIKCVMLEIKYNNSITKDYISPQKEDKFLAKLNERCENKIEIKDKRSSK